MTATTKSSLTTFDPALNMARQSLYRFAALSLLDPRAGSWEQLDALRSDPVPREAGALIRGLPEAQAEELGLGERPPADLRPERVLQCLPRTRHQLNDQFEATFGLLVSKACPPYETEYINSQFTFQRSNALADVSGFYRAFGLSPSQQHPERPDHIVLELEFMACLLRLERQAAGLSRRESQRRRQICRDAATKFVTDHLAWWVPAFARLLSHENRGGFYEAVGDLLASLIPAERALLGIAVPRQKAEPTQLDRPEACEGCQVAG